VKGAVVIFNFNNLCRTEISASSCPILFVPFGLLLEPTHYIQLTHAGDTAMALYADHYGELYRDPVTKHVACSTATFVYAYTDILRDALFLAGCALQLVVLSVAQAILNTHTLKEKTNRGTPYKR